MQLVEQHVIRRGDPRFAEIDRAALASINLYNAANYILRQSFIFSGGYIPYGKLDKRLQASPRFGPATVHNSVPPSENEPLYRYRVSVNYAQKL